MCQKRMIKLLRIDPTARLFLIQEFRPAVIRKALPVRCCRQCKVQESKILCHLQNRFFIRFHSGNNRRILDQIQQKERVKVCKNHVCCTALRFFRIHKCSAFSCNRTELFFLFFQTLLIHFQSGNFFFSKFPGCPLQPQDTAKRF